MAIGPSISAKLNSSSILNYLEVKLAPEEHTPLPEDVIRLAHLNGVIGLGAWPRPSHQDVMTCINNLPPQCCNDYNRVSFLRPKS